MAEERREKLVDMPDAGTLTGNEQVYVVRDQPGGPVDRRSTVARIRQGLATLADLAGISVGQGNVPPGGAAGAALIKASADSYDTMWDPTSGTGWVPDPTEEPDGRTLITDTGGLVYVDFDPSGGTVPDPAGEPDGLVITTEDDEYVLAVPASAPVTSVAGRTGAVTLAKSDVGLGNVDNTADINKPVSAATQTALDQKVIGPGLTIEVHTEATLPAEPRDADTIYLVTE